MRRARFEQRAGVFHNDFFCFSALRRHGRSEEDECYNWAVISLRGLLGLFVLSFRMEDGWSFMKAFCSAPGWGPQVIVGLRVVITLHSLYPLFCVGGLLVLHRSEYQVSVTRSFKNVPYGRGRKRCQIETMSNPSPDRLIECLTER